MNVEAAIDELYRQPLGDFVLARSALARTLSGADASRVKGLKKPTIVPWAVNQVYWGAREAFDRVRKTGAVVRRAYVSALTKGRAQDLKPVLQAHRAAIAAAVEKAVVFARELDAQPDVEATARTFEALSLADDVPERLGRFTQPLRPGGFEMLAGVKPKHSAPAPVHDIPESRRKPPAPISEQQRRGEAAAREIERHRKALAKRRAAAIATAERQLASAAGREQRARVAWEHARAEAERARRSLEQLQSESRE